MNLCLSYRSITQGKLSLLQSLSCVREGHSAGRQANLEEANNVMSCKVCAFRRVAYLVANMVFLADVLALVEYD